jgi:hypothetical protein
MYFVVFEPVEANLQKAGCNGYCCGNKNAMNFIGDKKQDNGEKIEQKFHV